MNWKRIGASAAGLLLAVQTVIMPGAQAAPNGDIEIILDGKSLQSDASPYIVQGANVTMVPLRVISEGLGAQVNWSEASGTVTITAQDQNISMENGGQSATVNGKSVRLDASARMTSGRVMVPLRFVGEALGLKVDWQATERVITLSSGKEGVSTGANTSAGNSTIPDTSASVNQESESTDQNASDDGQAMGTSPSTSTSENSSNAANGNVVQVKASTSMRGAWISTINGDWPSSAARSSAEKQKQEFTKMLDDLQGMGINAVFVQVRASGDALYPSSLVPWSKYLTNTQGKNPGYDPLKFMISESHKRGMEFHAWFNPFRANSTGTTSGLAANHVANQHPDWIVKNGSQLYINPGIPAARQHVITAIMEVVNGYDIDGVHLDDYFYPYSGTFDDDATFKAYNANNISNKGDWRRDNVNSFVRDLGKTIHASKSKVQFGISPFGVWRNKSQDLTGSDTKAGVTAYDTTFADVRTWINKGWIDYVAPQIYWSIGFPAAGYDKLVAWWSNEVKNSDVKLYIGHSPYKIGTPEKGWQTAQELIKQLELNENYKQVKGDIYFSAQHLRKNPYGLIQLLQNYYQM
ncbi:family 10 glycosylhydrolase [Paenibacillus kribbensis]|uniref:family 10 glycosylhydrolase n=1 Tax=Paenibacillus TaxID=44249 RepID=UPI00024EFEE9|nr:MULTISPECIES: family 10 glycosylhydrolase [Paenibacillus]EHS56686.1 lipoprotein precursor [Paenibacillus sp. Aloe-11]MEC0237318.1 family 10 glycosylhydrolase [Paenibacillus kribbensis]